jgi:hypothetical protein
MRSGHAGPVTMGRITCGSPWWTRPRDGTTLSQAFVRQRVVRRVSLPVILSPLVQRGWRRHRAKGGVFAFAPTLGVLAAGVAIGGDPDDGGETVARAATLTFQRSRSQRDGLLDPSLVTPLAGVTSTMHSTPCCARHLTGIPGLSSIAVLSSSTVAGFTRTAGRRLVWCIVRRTVSGVRRSARSIILSLSGT